MGTTISEKYKEVFYTKKNNIFTQKLFSYLINYITIKNMFLLLFLWI